MVMLTAATSENPCTVYFDEPIPQPRMVGLVSFAMKNPWLYLRSPAKIEVLDSRDQVLGQKTLSLFFYTPTDLSKYLNGEFKKLPTFNVTFDYDANTGILTLKNPDSLKLRFSQSFVHFLGTSQILEIFFTLTALK